MRKVQLSTPETTSKHEHYSDIIGGDVVSRNGLWCADRTTVEEKNRYVIMMTDYLSKYTFAKALRSDSAQETTEFFLDVCYQYVASAKLVTDQRPHFTADLARMFIESCKTTHVLDTSHRPMSMAQTELFNATFSRALAKLADEDEKDWNRFLRSVLYAYNTTHHSITAVLSFKVMFGNHSQLLMEPK